MTAPAARARVLILAPNPPAQGFGGAERHLHDLAVVLTPLCDQVIFRSRADAPPPSRWAKTLSKIEPMLTSPFATRRLVRNGLPDVDVVLSIELMGVGLKHGGHLHLFFGSYAGFRDMALQPAGGLSSMVRAAKGTLARMLERCTQGNLGAIANSTGLRDVFRARDIMVRDDVIPPPTDCDRFTPGDKGAARAELGLPQDKRLIMFAGRWEYAKGADRCARIFETAPEDWYLLIVTPSQYTWPMPRGRNFAVLTDLDTDRMISAYRAADALVQPSRFEGYSLVISEAQACGLPVLTSRVGQAAHFEQSDQPLVRASVIFDADDAKEWISRLTAVLGSDESQNSHSRAHRSYAEANVSFPTVQRIWERVLSEIFEDFSWQPHSPFSPQRMTAPRF